MRKSIFIEWLVVSGRTAYDQAHIGLVRFAFVPALAVMAFRYTPSHQRWLLNAVLVTYLVFMGLKLLGIYKTRKSS